MTEDPNPAGIFSDLATNPATKAAIMQDAALSVDDFADRHGQTIRQHYAKGGYKMDFEDGHQAAAQLWRYLRTPS
ncbi:hypothetical protein ACH50O_23545 (plasmid) [Methylomonas sp. 2BW1-5-20]|uniref:hypothetical protein n=1 Tax=Methylomonas sp. 2BW1-5-20 TaxID=3376686 RepID=UPI00404FB61B